MDARHARWIYWSACAVAAISVLFAIYVTLAWTALPETGTGSPGSVDPIIVAAVSIAYGALAWWAGRLIYRLLVGPDAPSQPLAPQSKTAPEDQ